MIVAGCDVGSLTAKAVIMNDNSFMAYEIIKISATTIGSATDVMKKALSSTSLQFSDIIYCYSTGKARMLRYASSFVVATYLKERLTPQCSRSVIQRLPTGGSCTQ